MSHKGPIIVCVINLKGGVGKSTIATLLARYGFNSRQADVLAIDLDPQANLSQALLGANGYTRFLRGKSPSIVELFDGFRPAVNGRSVSKLAPVDVVQTIDNFDEHWRLDVIPSRFDFSDNLTDAVRPDPKTLARFLADNFQHKDLIVIDCSPTESILTRAAYHASEKVLIPVRPEFFATIGFPLLAQSLASFRSKNRAHGIEVAGVVINNNTYEGGNRGGPGKERSMEEIEEEAGKNQWKVYKNEIPFSRGFPKMMRGDYSYSGNASDFNFFAREFFDDIGLKVKERW